MEKSALQAIDSRKISIQNLSISYLGQQCEELAKSSLSWDGNPLPNYTEGKPEVTILKITIPPGVKLPLHKHPVINAGVLISGEFTIVTKANKTLHLKAGDSFVEVVNTWHYGKNEGQTSTQLIMFYAGIAAKPIIIKPKPQRKYAGLIIRTLHS